MPCTPYEIVNFFNATTTTIGYEGYKPTLQVFYQQPDGSFQQAGVFTQVLLGTDQVQIDHGGPATGFVKITDCPIVIPNPVITGLISELEEPLISELGLILIEE